PSAEARQHAPEQPQEGFDGVTQELEHRVGRAVVRRAQPGREQQLDHDVHDDQDLVDVDDRREHPGDLGAGGRDRHQRFSSTASNASLKAALMPPRSSASSPRAVTPPGEATSRRIAIVSLPRRRSSSAVPASVWITSSAPCAAGIPLRTPASICASATSATYAGPHDISPIATSTRPSSSTTSVPSSANS